jgi:hypothetical protein
MHSSFQVMRHKKTPLPPRAGKAKTKWNRRDEASRKREERNQKTGNFFRTGGYPKRWTLDAGRWTLDAGRWTLDAGRWTLDAGRWTLDAGRPMRFVPQHILPLDANLLM